MTYKHRWKTVLAVAVLAIFLGPLNGGGVSLVTEAVAAEKVTWTGVTSSRMGGHWQLWEWMEKRIPEITNGEVEMEITSYGELGIGGTEMLRILRAGLVDIVDVNGGYVAGDWPVIEATELHGVTKSPEQLEAVYNAWMKNVVQPREDIMGGMVLASYYWNNTFCFTKFPVNSLEDIKGRRLRVNSANLAQYISALGGEPLQIPGIEIYNALQKGIAEGACMGPDTVAGFKMWEICPYMTDLGLSGSGGYIVVSRRSWEKLSENAREAILAAAPEMHKVAWAGGHWNNVNGVALAREKGMTLTVPAKPEWIPEFERISAEVILPWWFERAGAEGKEAFKMHIAPITGHQVD